MKVTAFVVIIIINTLFSCQPTVMDFDELTFQQRIDSLGSKIIDSAYKQIQQDCDTAMKYRLPDIVDSLLNIDTIHK